MSGKSEKKNAIADWNRTKGLWSFSRPGGIWLPAEGAID
jgi:hypothetical protein